MEIESSAFIEPELEIFDDDYECNDDNSSEIIEASKYSNQSDHSQNDYSFRFIEPEVIITEFSVEKLQALKNTRFLKDTLSQCPVCCKNFQRNSHLKRHLLIHTKEKPFQCDICGRSFNQSSSMKSHKQSVHSSNRPFVCTEKNCTKSFSNLPNLRVHQRSHLSSKEFKCSHCDRSFKYVNSLKSHEKVHFIDLVYVKNENVYDY